MSQKACRSWLVVPLFRAADVERAIVSGADAVVLDLVEFVSESEKATARAAARAAIERVQSGGACAYVQTTPQACGEDLRASVWPGLSGVVLSRVESAQQMQQIDKSLFLLEKERGIAGGTVAIVAALETARGNQDAYEVITASPRVCAATLGRADLVMDLRAEPTGDFHLMPYLMERLIIVSRAAGVTPLGAWWRAPDRGLLATPENTLQAARRGRAIGFKGALCLRPGQIEALNTAYA